MWNIEEERRFSNAVYVYHRQATHTYTQTIVLTLMHRTGPNISSFQILLLVGTSMIIVGAMKYPVSDPEVTIDVYVNERELVASR